MCKVCYILDCQGSSSFVVCWCVKTVWGMFCCMQLCQGVWCLLYSIFDFWSYDVHEVISAICHIMYLIWDQFCIMLDCQDYVFELMLFGWSDQEEWDGHGMWHVWEIREVHTGFWWGDLKDLGRPKHRWENNIEMDLRKVGWGGVDWIDLVQDRDRWQAIVIAVMNLWVP